MICRHPTMLDGLHVAILFEELRPWLDDHFCEEAGEI